MKSQRDLDSTEPLVRRLADLAPSDWPTSIVAIIGFLAGAVGGAWLGWNESFLALLAAILAGGVAGILIVILVFGVMRATAG
jgi:hypothetical protein